MRSLPNKYILTCLSLAVILTGLVFANRSIKKSEAQSALISEAESAKVEYADGDIVFQNSTSAYCVRIGRMTHSTWNQVGILFSRNNEWYVYEVDEAVKQIKFSRWIDNGNQGKYEIKRLVNRDKLLTDSVISHMKTMADDYTDTNSDMFFSQDDGKLYNSELIYKVYLKAAKIKLAEMTPLKDCDFSYADAQKVISIKYGSTNIPADSLIISPQAILNSNKLVTVFTTN